VCEPCDLNCKTCVGRADNCSSCEVGVYLRTENNTCGNSCLSTNQYKDEVERVCKECDISCSLCNGSGPSNCTACTNTSLFLNPDGVCKLTCPTMGYYATNGTCEACNGSCLTCSGPAADNCLSCGSPKWLRPESMSCEDGGCLLSN